MMQAHLEQPVLRVLVPRLRERLFSMMRSWLCCQKQAVDSESRAARNSVGGRAQSSV